MKYQLHLQLNLSAGTNPIPLALSSYSDIVNLCYTSEIYFMRRQLKRNVANFVLPIDRFSGNRKPFEIQICLVFAPFNSTFFVSPALSIFYVTHLPYLFVSVNQQSQAV